ncbi:hypothetical protein BGW80DRAFT_1307352 [Lactifluus volemus]|nr:hypothetical protein BGW80DRAFT_1307352 [Lactifluus volemus]
MCATDPPPLPPNDSPHFGAAVLATNAMADLDMNRILAPSDVSRRLGRDNGQYSQAYKYKVIGSNKFVSYILLFSTSFFLVGSGSTLLIVFSGCVPDLYTLVEERLPDGWESRVRD